MGFPRFSLMSGGVRLQQSITMYAVLVGAAQYLQHYQDIRSRHNAVLQFVPSHGFNNGDLGALRCIVETRNGQGLAPGPVVLNYGPACNFAPKSNVPGVFAGALDAMFKAQEERLKGEAAHNKAAAGAEAAAAQEAAKKAAEEEKKKKEIAENAKKAAEEEKRKKEEEARLEAIAAVSITV